MDSLERLDKILVFKGLFESRSKAEQAILSGKVKVDSKVIDKPGKKIQYELLLVNKYNDKNDDRFKVEDDLKVGIEELYYKIYIYIYKI